MAVSYVASLGYGVSKTSSVSWDLSTSKGTATLAEDDVIVVVASYDNVSQTTPTITVSGGTGVTWTQRSVSMANNVASNASVICAIWTGIVGAAGWDAATDTVTITMSQSRTAKSAMCAGFTGLDVSSLVRAGTNANQDLSGTSRAQSLAGAPVAGDLVVFAAAHESDSTVTFDSDTTDGTWVGLLGGTGGDAVGTTGGTNSTNAQITGAYKIVTGTTVQTYDISWSVSSDYGVCIIAFAADTAASHLGDGTITATPAITGTGFLSPLGTGAVTVTPTITGQGVTEILVSGTVTVTPTVSGDGTITEAVHLGDGTITATPTVTGAGTVTILGTGAVTVTPVVDGLGSVAEAQWIGSGSIVAAPTITGQGYLSQGGSGVVTVAPTLTAYAIATPAGGFLMSAAQIADALAQWPDARNLPEGVLSNLLESSWAACETFLPTAITTAVDYVPADVPSYVTANVLHARDVFGATRRDGDVIGFDNYAIRVRPLSSTVKALLRPSTGRALVG